MRWVIARILAKISILKSVRRPVDLFDWALLSLACKINSLFALEFDWNMFYLSMAYDLATKCELAIYGKTIICCHCKAKHTQKPTKSLLKMRIAKEIELCLADIMFFGCFYKQICLFLHMSALTAEQLWKLQFVKAVVCVCVCILLFGFDRPENGFLMREIAKLQKKKS